MWEKRRNMDFNRQNTQRNATAVPPSQPEPLIPQRSGKRSHRRIGVSKNPVGWGLLLIALVLIAFGLLWFFRANSINELSQVNSKEYQAIFLSNGQVYFGKLDTLNSQYAKMTDIFYLQVNQSVQPKQNSSSQPQNVSLVKLGNELHGPEDAMIINRQQILFWENLKPTGKVSQAIKRYQQTGGSSTPATSTPTSSDTNSSNTTPSSSNTSSTSSSSTTPTSK